MILKGVRPTSILHKANSCLSLTIRSEIYLGNEYFILKENKAPAAYIKRWMVLGEVKEINAKTFEYLTDYHYYDFSDNVEDIIIKVGEHADQKGCIKFQFKDSFVWLNHKYYSYFKNLGIEFRFTGTVSPVGMFIENEFVGMLLPVRILN